MNESGIYPVGNRVLIEPDEIERVTQGGIIIPDTAADKHAMAQSIGTVVCIGPDCWFHEVVKDSEERVTQTVGFSAEQFDVGDRVCFSKYAGIQMPGKDGRQYRLVRIGDVSARVDEGVDFTDLKPRQPLSGVSGVG